MRCRLTKSLLSITLLSSAFLFALSLHSGESIAAVKVKADGGGADQAAVSDRGKEKNGDKKKRRFKEGELLVRFKKGVGKEKAQSIHQKMGAAVQRSYRVPSGLHLVTIPAGKALEKVLSAYRKNQDVLYAEPNYLYEALVSPNDPSFSSLWGLDNTGQSGGIPDADINAPEAWDITTGSPDTIIAVIDTGVDYTHEDLAANIWVNPGEIAGNGIDDDGNGYIDDVHGINAILHSGDPRDDHGHGTHVSGTIAAAGNNGIGVVGVNWNAKIIGCKFLDSYGNGTDAGAIACLDYLYDLKTREINPVNIVASNNSWGGSAHSQALLEAIDAHRSARMLFIAAAGNDTNDIDSTPHYPASFSLPHMISVAAIGHADSLAWFSNYGRHSVHVAAPGKYIMSTMPGNSYAYKSGTSMAAPHVTGLVGLLKAQDPAREWKALKNLVLAGGQDRAAAAGKTITGKRIRAFDIDGAGSLSCESQVVYARLQPVQSAISVNLASSLGLAVQHINCAAPNGEVTVPVSNGDQVVLRDDGQGFDQEAGDGIYSAWWTPSQTGIYTLTFPGNDIITAGVSENYRAPVETTYQYRSIDGTNLGLGDDSSVKVISPFPIFFGNHPIGYTDFYVSSYGTISFTESSAWGLNMALPTVRYQTLVAPFWDYLFPQGANNVYWEVIGTAPNRELVIEWRNVSHFYAREHPATFQVVFSEVSADVLFNYADVYFGDWTYDAGGLATVGVQIAPNFAQQYSYNSPTLRNDLALLFRISSLKAYAGPDRAVSPGSTVMLDGGSSRDTEGTIVSYQWVQTAGASITLSGADTATPSFMAQPTSKR